MSAIDRHSLIKIIIMPQLLYILHNAPVWILAHYLHKIKSIKLETFQRDKDAGGLAIPTASLYYIIGWGQRGGVEATRKLLS